MRGETQVGAPGVSERRSAPARLPAPGGADPSSIGVLGLRRMEEARASKQPHLVILSGRRRVGKTELLAHSGRGKPIACLAAAHVPVRSGASCYSYR